VRILAAQIPDGHPQGAQPGRALINAQINPNEHKKTAKAQAYAAANVEAEQVKTTKVQTLTVQDLAKAWLLDGVPRKDGNAELQRRFNKDLFPALGKTAVSVSEHDIRALIRAVINRRAHRQAISFSPTSLRCSAGPESANLGGPY
jgi:adenylate kinase family enzyme